MPPKRRNRTSGRERVPATEVGPSRQTRPANSRSDGAAASGQTRSTGRSAPAPVARSSPVSKYRSNTWLFAGVAAIGILIAAGIYFLYVGRTSSAVPSVTGTAFFGTPEASEGRDHVNEGTLISYKNNPPTSGSHYPSPMPWGVVTTDTYPGYWVHNLEHGGVVVLYNCPTGCADLQAQLQKAYDTFPKDKFNEVKMVVTPYSKLPVKVAAVAWTYYQPFTDQTFSLDHLLQFYEAHVDKGPEDVP